MVSASKTVEFKSPISGSRLIEAVKAIIDSGEDRETRFISNRGYEDGDYFIIGQHSMETISQFIVTVSLEEKRIRPEASYVSCAVQHHLWPYAYYPLGYGDFEAYVISNVQKFADRLEKEIAGGDTDTAKTWPQSVNVCALCHRILSRSFDEAYHCTTHGKNPPVHSIAVQPA